MKISFITVILCIVCNILFAQKRLQILKVKLGSFKKYELFAGDVLEYKLKGDHFYSHHRISEMNDSLILLHDNSIIRLSEIKAIRVKRGNHLMKTFSGLCIRGAIGYVTLDFLNNLILESAFRVDKSALVVSGSFLIAYVIFRELSKKRIRIKQNVTLKVLDLDFQKLN